MGILWSKLYSLYQSFGTLEPSRILMLGLDAAGKTTILYKLKLNENLQTIPTIGFNVETVSPCSGLVFTVWDIGGQGKLRELWRHYFRDTQGLLFVVDSTDLSRMTLAKEELHSILQDEEMRGVPVVIIANKQDLPGASSPSQMTDLLELRELSAAKHQWFIQAASAPHGDGIYEAVEAMARLVRDFQRSAT